MLCVSTYRYRRVTVEVICTIYLSIVNAHTLNLLSGSGSLLPCLLHLSSLENPDVSSVPFSDT
jgi:hypothetical protein